MAKKNRTKSKTVGDDIRVTIGDNASNVAAGKEVYQEVRQQTGVQVTEADMAIVHKLFAELLSVVETQVPPDKKEAAKERIKELEEAVATQEPDITTMEYVKKWFEKQVPALTGAIVSILIHPIVGKIVEASGEIAAAEFKRRFGGA